MVLEMHIRRSSPAEIVHTLINLSTDWVMAVHSCVRNRQKQSHQNNRVSEFSTEGIVKQFLHGDSTFGVSCSTVPRCTYLKGFVGGRNIVSGVTVQ